MKRINLTFLPLLLPLAYTAFFLLRNNQLPANDAANYFYTAINLYQSFHDQGILRGLFHFYTERGWRPIFFPNLALPFLLISHGNLFFAYACIAMLSILSSITYVYLFSRLMLEKIPAILAAAVICLLPFVQAQAVMFYSEAALFPCIIGGLYHLIRSDYLRNSNHAAMFAALTALAVIIRPVEAVTHLLFIFVVLTSLGYYKKIFSAAQILNIIFICLFAVFLFFAAASLPYRHGTVLAVIDGGGVQDVLLASRLHYAFIISAFAALLSGLFAYALRKRAQHEKNYLVSAFAAWITIVLIWFLPFASETFQWIYRTSLGDVAMSTGSLSGSQFSWQVLLIYLQDEGLFAIAMIALTAMLALFALKSKCKKTLISTPVLYLLLLTPFALWESFYTVQVISRKLSIAFPALLLILLLIALQPGKWQRLRTSLISVLLIVQFALLCVLLHEDYQNKKSVIHYSIGYFIPEPSTIHPNPHDVVMTFLNQQANLLHITSVGLEVIPGTPDARHPIEAEPINPFLLSMMAAAYKTPYYANYLYFAEYSDKSLQKVREYDAVFLSDHLDSMEVSARAASGYWQKYLAETNPSIKTFYELLYHYSANKLDVIGFKSGPCLVVKTQKEGDYHACLLLKG
jgi:hypothetical protein